MQLQRLLVILGILLVLSLLTGCQSTGKVTFQDSATEHKADEQENIKEGTSQPRGFNPVQHVENLFNYIGLGTGQNVDPYLARINERCLTGDLAECFKSRALNYFSDFFDHAEYSLNDNVQIKRMSDQVVAEVHRQPYEYSNEPRSGETEWDQMVNFMKRKMERFVKTMSFELTIPDDGETGVNDEYKPRFLNEIADELDMIENKKDTLFSRHRLRKFLIPFLLILKLFKVKLLLLLPLILGLASFKKFLGFLAIIIPGLIGFFKLYKPYPNYYPQYTKNGVAQPHYESHPNFDYHGDYYGNVDSYGHDLAYHGYHHYKS